MDIWLITQRVGLIDANVRGLCGRHIALRSTALGRYKYEWPECGDIDSKVSRDTAARIRYKLPKHVFKLYKSAEVHTKHGHSFSFAMKAMFAVVPLFFLFMYMSWSTINSKFNPKPVQAAQAGQIHQGKSSAILPAGLPVGFESIPQDLLNEIPVVPGRPESAPMYASLRQVVAMPWPDACVEMKERCNCYTDQGLRIVEIDTKTCIDNLKKGKVFNPYRRQDAPVQVVYHQPASIP